MSIQGRGSTWWALRAACCAGETAGGSSRPAAASAEEGACWWLHAAQELASRKLQVRACCTLPGLTSCTAAGAVMELSLCVMMMSGSSLPS
jgi:hypothetical protein